MLTWKEKYEAVVDDLVSLRGRIDALGEDLQDISPFKRSRRKGRDPDEIACYASNSLEGTLALLRELLAASKPARKGWKT